MESEVLAVAKKTEKPAVIFLRVYGAQKARLEAQKAKHGLEANDIARTGLMHELHRLEQLQHVPAEYAELLAECQQLGLDPAPHLRALIADAAGGPN